MPFYPLSVTQGEGHCYGFLGQNYKRNELVM